MSEKLKIIISGGGTGGHIFPAISIANAVREKNPGAEILFVGAKGRMEMEKVPAAGYPIIGLWISGLQRRLTWKNLLFPFKVISSLIKSSAILRSFRPDVAVGVGGYASGPLIRAAAAKGIPTLIQEQNSYPGITNKMLASKVDRICVAYEGMERFFPASKIILTGNPVRQEIENTAAGREEACKYFSLDPSRKTVLVIGGSLGALSINSAVMNGLQKLHDNGLQMIWQTGNFFYETAAKAVILLEDKGIRAYRFIERMDLAYAAADLIVSRAGAIALSELCIIGKPSIVVPSPYVAEDHQTKNAKALASRDAAIIVSDKDTESQLLSSIVALVTDEQKMKSLGENMTSLAQRNAASAIADIVMKLAKK
jgi:UDP-N-acetylglucosamine--N-acetylmuramyl-(pentapeptide) pyrophosphoryl-undecaprenol N-acetylglucosamine transferase